MEWTEEQYKRFEKFILDDNMDFYEEYTIHLMDEEQEKFFFYDVRILSSTAFSCSFSGGGIMGIAGMLLGVPIAASIYRLLKEDVNRQEAVN